MTNEEHEIKQLREINKEMLEALEKIKIYYNDFSIVKIPMGEIRDILNKAIKKAKGEV